ncbi:hypothetical protein AAY473_022820 [Plecturocebus cupreus]
MALTSQAQVIFLPQPPEQLGPQCLYSRTDPNLRITDFLYNGVVIFFFHEMEFCSCSPGWSAMVRYQLTVASASQGFIMLARLVLEHLTSEDLSALTTQSAGIIGMAPTPWCSLAPSTRQPGRPLCQSLGWRIVSSLGAAPSAGLLGNGGLLGHLADHVVEDAPVEEVSELHVGVKPHDSLKGLSGIQLQHKEMEELLEAGQLCSEEILPSLPLRGELPPGMSLLHTHQQERALSRPVSGAACTILFTSQDDQGQACLLVPLSSVKDIKLKKRKGSFIDAGEAESGHRPPEHCDSPASVSPVTRITGAHRQAQLIFVFLVETGFHHAGQTCLEPLTSSDPLTSASQSTGITGISYCSWP